MVTFTDLAILLALGLAAYLGAKRGVVRQVVVSVGVLLSICVVALLYVKLAFLTGQSGTRTVILLLLGLAAGILCFDVSSTAGGWLGRVVKNRVHISKRVNQVGGAAIGVLAGVVGVWIIAAMLAGIGPLAVQSQVARSFVVRATQSVAKQPALFTRVAGLLKPFSSPQAFVGADPTFEIAGTDVNQEYAELDAATTKATHSVVKVRAWGCGAVSSGTGFIVADRMILTNAHVVAGADRLTMTDGGGEHVAQALWFDPKLDVAILAANDKLSGEPLKIDSNEIAPGAIAAFLGYAGGGDLVTGDAVIMQVLNATGYDIYNGAQTTRRIYAFRSTVVPGDSGGPLVTVNGHVSGLVFGHSNDSNKTGYAIAGKQLSPIVRQVQAKQQASGTGSCTG